MVATASRLTVVVPVYNRADIVGRTLDSLAAQTLRPLTLVLVDNNSTDGSLSVLERWAAARRSPSLDVSVLSETLPGAAAARNRGLEAVTTPYVMFFDSDDFMAPGLTAAVMRAFDRPSHPDIVTWDIDIELPGGTLRRQRADVRPSRLMFNALVHGKLSTARYAARTELVRRAGGWDTTVRAWDDMELSVRLLLENPVVGRLGTDAPQVTALFTPGSITHTTMSQVPDPRLEHALDCCTASLARAGRSAALRWVDYRRALLAAEYARAGATAQARRLLADIKSAPRWVYRLLNLKHRLYRRGTHLLAPFPRHL